MKKIYSVILVVSFLIGTMQPILPMIEYQLHEGDVFELFYKGEISTENVCDLNVSKLDNGKKQQSDENRNLLDIDYYPLALQISTIPKSIVFPYETTFHLLTIINIDSPLILPISPPPRFS